MGRDAIGRRRQPRLQARSAAATDTTQVRCPPAVVWNATAARVGYCVCTPSYGKATVASVSAGQCAAPRRQRAPVAVCRRLAFARGTPASAARTVQCVAPSMEVGDKTCDSSLTRRRHQPHASAYHPHRWREDPPAPAVRGFTATTRRWAALRGRPPFRSMGGVEGALAPALSLDPSIPFIVQHPWGPNAFIYEIPLEEPADDAVRGAVVEPLAALHN